MLNDKIKVKIKKSQFFLLNDKKYKNQFTST
jgi:hypothetical protein